MLWEKYTHTQRERERDIEIKKKFVKNKIFQCISAIYIVLYILIQKERIHLLEDVGKE